MSILIASIEELISPRLVEHLSAQSGLPGAKVRTGMTGAVATILDGLVGKANDPRTMNQVADLVRTSPADDMPAQLIGDGASLQQPGHQLVGLAGNDPQTMAKRVSGFLGVGGGASAGLVAAAAAIVLGAFRKLAQARGGLDAGLLSSTLVDEGREIHASVPQSLLGEPPHVIATRVERIEEPAARRPTSRWWLWPLLALAAVLLAMWAFGRARMHQQRTREVPRGELTAPHTVPAPQPDR
ncbi:MAG TPA: DUF937 domain-containing protein [Kofleriaceae bacterium]|nr:DUF937 domain-containing protein [Kofleriaceae bacterium]